MGAAWMAFAEAGDPDAGGRIPDWPPCRAERPAAMVFDEKCRVESRPQAMGRQSADAMLEDVRGAHLTGGPARNRR
jgi:carboxylesterase type B